MRLLLLGCSATKRSNPSLLPAIERYDGPAYRVLRRNRPCDLLLWILSARFGFIPETMLLPNYNQRMSLQQAQAFQAGTSAKLDQILASIKFSSIFLNMGKIYATSFEASCALPVFYTLGRVHMAQGSIGSRLHQMKQWLMQPELPDDSLFPEQIWVKGPFPSGNVWGRSIGDASLSTSQSIKMEERTYARNTKSTKDPTTLYPVYSEAQTRRRDG